MEDGKRTPRSLVYVQLWSCRLILIMQSSTSRSGMCIVKELMSRMHVSKVTRMSKFQISLHVIMRMNKSVYSAVYILCSLFVHISIAMWYTRRATSRPPRWRCSCHCCRRRCGSRSWLCWGRYRPPGAGWCSAQVMNLTSTQLQVPWP